VKDPREERKDEYLVQAENALAEFSRNLVELTQRAEAEDSATRSAFDRAKRDFGKKAEELRKILAEVAPLPPQAARGRKHEIDAALKRTEAAYTRALSVFD
jgi:hypothetical protein